MNRDIDAAAEDFIVGWARELPASHEFDLVLHLATPPAADRTAGGEAAVRHSFASRAPVKDRELRRLARMSAGLLPPSGQEAGTAGAAGATGCGSCASG